MGTGYNVACKADRLLVEFKDRKEMRILRSVSFRCVFI